MAAGFTVPAGAGEPIEIVGEQVRLLADSARTDGRFAVFEEISPPRGGPPLHRHARDDEFFFVLEGTLKFVLDGRESTVHAGGFVFAPRGSVHTFVNVGAAPSRMLIACSPGGIEEPFRTCHRLSRERPLTPADLADAFGAVGIEFLGPPLTP